MASSSTAAACAPKSAEVPCSSLASIRVNTQYTKVTTNP
jgi:hypothetical protein